MLKIAVSGAAGRMGKTLVQTVCSSTGVGLTSATEQSGQSAIGMDAGVLAGIGDLGVQVTDTLRCQEFDVLIEFTTPEATMEHARQCAKAGKDIVIGTTGLSDEQKLELKNLSDSIRIVFAPNMSVGINLCLKLLETAAKTLGDSVDIEIIEAHHHNKVDAPSGTALKMGEVIADALDRSLDTHGVFERHGVTGPREKGTIGFATIRAGDIIGEHTAMFAGAGERLEITHRSNSRVTYASGSIRAAKWLADQPPGLYEMTDVLEL